MIKFEQLRAIFLVAWVASTSFSIPMMVMLIVFFSFMPFALVGRELDDGGLLELIQDRFPQTTTGYDGPPAAILVPGGGLNTYVVAVEQGERPPGAGERVTAALEFARTFPSSKIVFSGAGEVNPTPLIVREGIRKDQIVRETTSSDTFENAASAARILQPKRDDCFILVTSAWHMPRAAGSYRAARFTISTHSVDYETIQKPGAGETARYEFIGLIAYRLA